MRFVLDSEGLDGDETLWIDDAEGMVVKGA
jgi:hypothetical protein